MAKPSYQQMAAHFAAQSAPDAPKNNNTYLQLRDFYDKLNRRSAFLDPRDKATYQTVNNLLLSIRDVLKMSTVLSESVKNKDQQEIQDNLMVSAAACENFEKCLEAFKPITMDQPAFQTQKQAVENFENVRYDQGGPILNAAGISDVELKYEDIDDLKEDMKEEIQENLAFPERKEKQEKRETLFNFEHDQTEQEKILEQQKEEIRLKELTAEHEAAENYVLYGDKPIKTVRWTRKEELDGKRPYEPSPLDQPTQEKSWKNYRLLHLRNADPEKENFQENLAKAIIATFHMSRPEEDRKPFSLKLARSHAKQLMNLPEFKQFCGNKKLVRKYLNGDKLFQACGSLFRPFQLTDQEKGTDILSALKKMTDKMDPTDGQSKEWNALIKTMKSLNPYADEDEQEKQMQSVFDATAAYMKGRKSVRSTEEERNQFNQALDVLGTLAKANDFAKNAANVIVERINDVRRGAFHKHEYVHIDDFGEDKIDQHTNQITRHDSLDDIEPERESSSSDPLQI